ncbi:MAG: hypothetical protein RL662_1495 [Bacteroidota bacterium]|jgi:hypothetical protein
MRKQLILALLLLCTYGVMAQTSKHSKRMNSYENEWSQVNKFEEEDLPKSASSTTDGILRQALAEKNTPQVIKALIHKNKYKVAIDQQESTSIFNDLEALLSNTNHVSDKALLHSMLAELYLDYYNNQAWKIRQRTNISGSIPKDMEEWSKNIFEEKALINLSLSIESQVQLISTPTQSYQDIIQLGKDSQRLSPTLYDFLMNRAIEQSARITQDYERSNTFLKALQQNKIPLSDLAMPTSDYLKLDFTEKEDLATLLYYQRYLQSLTNRAIHEVIALTELKKVNYLSNRSETYRTKYAYKTLLALQEQYKAYDYNVEIIGNLINQIQTNSNTYYRGDTDKDEENTKKAYDWCVQGINMYPNYSRINILKEKRAQLENPIASITGQSVYHPNNKEKIFKLSFKNLKQADIKVIDKKSNTVVESKNIKLNPKTSYSHQETEFTINLNKEGDYEIIAEYDQKGNKQSEENTLVFSISKLASFARGISNDQYEFYVVDRLTSTPIENATITFYSTDWNSKEYTKLTSIQTDSKGLARLDGKDYFTQKNRLRYVYRVSQGNTVLPTYLDLPYNAGYRQSPDYTSKNNVSILTDRSIYRPGQPLYFKIISTKQVNKNTTQLNANVPYTIGLYDVNNQKVSEKTMNTNDFGSLAGAFIIPKSGLAGQYRIAVDNWSQYVSVEEYKRPTFQITFDKLSKSYAFGDRVTIKGHVENFSGIKVQNATLNYTIVKSSLLRWWMPSPTETLDMGSVISQEDGSFQISVDIPQNDTRQANFNSIYNYEIQASVTDLNGETQNGTFNFVIGDASTILSVNIPEQLDKNSKDKLQVKATNLNGEPIACEGTFTLYSILPNDSIKAEIHTGKFSTETGTDLMDNLRKLPSAKYLAILKSKDDKNREVVSKNYFVLYSTTDTNPPIETNEWLIAKQTSFNTTQHAEIVVGVSANDVSILYDLMKGDELIERQQFKLSNSNKTYSIPYKEEYGDNITAIFTYAVNEKAYVKQVDLTKKEEAKNLNLKLEVFRDKLRPGQQEEWRISVKDNANKPAFAELLASMYDSSLDKIGRPTSWNLQQAAQLYAYPSLFQPYGFDNIAGYTYFSSTNYNIKQLSWDYLNWFNFNLNHYQPYPYATTDMMVGAGSTSNRMRASKVAQPSVLPEAVMAKQSLDVNVPAEPSLTQGNTAPQLRQNFNETAFFYPQLQTNEKGETIISFIVPESNTTWKFRALAYDKALNIGQLEALSISSKELMITPNMPRFVRQGDKTSISTKISNLSDQSITGKVKIEFFDPLTDEVKNIAVDNQFQDFTLAKDASGSVSWLFNVPTNTETLGLRIIAQNESFSDGEQHVIPVLSNKMLVTESMTMNINGKQTKNFVFDKLINNQSNTLSSYRLTLEYTGNPAWYAIQALPTLSNPTNENVVNWIASYYVNTLGRSITQQYPNVNKMLKTWMQQGGDKQTLVSKLEKNDELKSALLEETPWVVEAKDQTEQMSRLSLLFDLNNTNQQTQQAINKLQELQNVDGGWSWYKGMRSSRSITNYVLYCFSQLVRLNAISYPQTEREIQINALKYLDAEIANDFEELKKNNTDWQNIKSVSTTQLEAMYVRSYYRDIPLTREAIQADKFYTSVVEKNWTSLNMYERALLVMLTTQNGNKKLAEKIMQSIREHATTNNEMGMYWANNTNQSFMSKSDITTHTFLMEAFQQTKAPSHEMDLMKQWLLKQKQTQAWESTHATIDAIYALLSTGSDWLANSGDTKITINKKVLQPQQKEQGTGYIKESWMGKQIQPQMGKVEIEKLDEGTTWGALYWQYYEDLDKITAQKGALHIEKKLFIEKSTDKGKTLVAVNESTPLKVGDKVIVRLTLRTDRDMEFVHLKDMRASCFEPLETISGIKHQAMSSYYQSTKDASTNFYFDYLAKGTYVFEYPVYTNRTGEYTNGITSIQCMYAPEFVSHTAGVQVSVK